MNCCLPAKGIWFFLKFVYNHWHPPTNSALNKSYLFQMMYSDSGVSVQGHQYRVKHIVCSLICWLLPCIPVGVVLGSKTTKYDVMNMRNCFPGGTDTGFFTTTFLTEIAQGVGCTCLFLVAYKLLMVRCLLWVDIEITNCHSFWDILKGAMLQWYITIIHRSGGG